MNAKYHDQRIILIWLSKELPAGLIDEGETPEQAAIRELQEETGFKAAKVLEVSPLEVCDPGRFPLLGSAVTACLNRRRAAGMTTANMKLVAVDVPFPDKLEKSAQKLEPGEFITARIVEIAKLSDELKGKHRLPWLIAGINVFLSRVREEGLQ